MADDVVLARMAQLETAVRKAGEALGRLRDENTRLTGELHRLGEENAQLTREVRRLGDDRLQVLAQIDTLLKDIGKLDLE